MSFFALSMSITVFAALLFNALAVIAISATRNRRDRAPLLATFVLVFGLLSTRLIITLLIGPAP